MYVEEVLGGITKDRIGKVRRPFLYCHIFLNSLVMQGIILGHDVFPLDADLFKLMSRHDECGEGTMQES